MSAARMTVRVSANSCRHISRAVCRSRVSCHVSPRVPATHLALLLHYVGPLLLLLGLQHHLGTRHLLALPRPAATIRYDDIRSGIRGPAPSGRQLVFAGEGIEDSVGPDILQAGLVLHRELVPGPASPSSLVLQTINRCTITEKAPTSGLVSIVSYSRPSLMIIASRTQFHVERLWGQRMFSIVS